jgi:hypothetical protein
MRVVLEGNASEEVAVESGVPQGTVLGPLLFLCHINDLPESVTSTVRLFADDCLLYREIRSFRDHLALQADLNNLEKWADTWGMRFNAQKCYVMSTKPKTSYMYNLCGTILQNVDHNPYLGIQISADLKWTTHITALCKRAGSTLGFLRRNLRNCPKECRRLAYVALVRSTLEYGAVVWDPYAQQDIDRLERIQRQAARYITRDYRSRDAGCVTEMLRYLQLPPLQDRRRQLRLTMLYKIAGGLVPAIPPDTFLTPADGSRRRVKAKTFADHQTHNIIQRQTYNNNRGFKLPDAKSEQFRGSFFIRTPLEWNRLEDSVVQQQTASAFSAAVGRLEAAFFQ